MTWDQVVQLLPHAVGTGLSVAIGVFALRRRVTAGVVSYAVATLLAGGWTLGYALETTATSLAAKIFWDDVQFVFSCGLPLAWLAFAARYTGHAPAQPWRTHGALALPMLAFLLLLATDHLHHLVRPRAWLVPGEPFSSLQYDFTPPILAVAVYSYLLVLLYLVLLAWAFTRARHAYRTHLAIVMAGSALPVLGTLATLTVLSESPGRDVSPFTFTAGNAIIAFGLFRWQLFRLAPLGRHIAIENMADAVVILDDSDTVVDLNPAAARVAGRAAAELIGQPLGVAFPAQQDLVARFAGTVQARAEVELAAGRHVELSIEPLLDQGGNHRGRVVVARDISERKRAEQEIALHRDGLERLVTERTTALRESEQRYRGLFEGVPIGLYRSTGSGQIADVNPAAARMLGYADPRELIGQYTQLFWMSPEERERRLSETDPDGAFDIEMQLRTRQREIIWVHNIGRAVRDPQGQILYVQGSLKDISERKRAEEALRAAEERYRTLFETAADCIFLMDDTRVIECNRAGRTLFGATGDEILGREPHGLALSPLLQADGQHSIEKGRQEILAALGGEPQRFEWRHLRLDGTQFDAEVSLARVEVEGGLRLLAVVRDVSERRRAEEALRRSEERYRSIVETTGEWIWELDLEGRHTYSSPVGEEILGYRTVELVGQDCFLLIHPEDRERARELVAAALSSGRGWRGQLLRWRHKQGRYRTLESNAVLVLDDAGRPRGFRGSDRDVTERLLAQEALRQSEERYRIVSGLTSDFAYAFDVAPDGELKVQWLTDAAGRITGYSPTELAAGWRLLLHPEDLPSAAQQLSALLAGQSHTAEFRIVRKDGKVAWARNYATPFWSAKEQRTVQIFGAIQDITARRTAEAEQRRLTEELRLLHSRLETIRSDEGRRIARRVHDEVGQPLTALQIDLAHLRREAPVDERDRRERLDTAARLIAETLETVRGIAQELHPRILDDLGLAAAVSAYARGRCTRAGLAWQVDVPEDMLLDRRRAEALYRVYREALTNVVRHAGADSVRISIRDEAGWIELAVEDDGSGMPQRTEDTSQSLGLLYMRESMRALGGTCEIASNPGRGTMVTARIPRVDLPGASPEDQDGGRAGGTA